LPGRLRRSRWILKFIQAASPWIDALVIARFASSSRLLLVKPHRSALAYLLTCHWLPFRRPRFVISWLTLPEAPKGLTRAMYRIGLPRVDAAFVFTPKELRLYRDDFNLKDGQLKLVSLMVPEEAPEVPAVPLEEYYDVIMTGLSGRDWELFGRVCKAMPDLRFIAIAKHAILGGIEEMPNLTKMEDLPYIEYCEMMMRSKLVMLLLADRFGATGQRDLLAIGAMARPLIVTRTEAIEHYTGDEGSVRFVEGDDERAIAAVLRDALARPEERAAMGHALRRRILDRCSAESVARNWSENLAPYLS
jgi:glycosyltransferase involved in cell wall biosynthesis